MRNSNFLSTYCSTVKAVCLQARLSGQKVLVTVLSRTDTFQSDPHVKDYPPERYTYIISEASANVKISNVVIPRTGKARPPPILTASSNVLWLG